MTGSRAHLDWFLAAFGLVCLTLIPAAIFAASQNTLNGNKEVPALSAYAGDAACAECHQQEAKSYASTGHARDSAPASAESIKGKFTAGENILYTTTPGVALSMTSTPEGFYQIVLDASRPDLNFAKRFDIVVGTGRHGQSYLFWQGDELFQLPASYWTLNDRWVMSPGFPADRIQFNRPVIPSCLECHASYFTSLNPPENRFSNLVLGIGCERCHGPGTRHVALERAARAKAGKSRDLAIVNPAHLSHERQIDLCSLCHAGVSDPIRPSMTFVAGDNIRDFIAIPPMAPAAPVDVHGNQVAALQQSKCFSSGTMTCSTCHNVHEPQEDADSYSSHCLACHEMKACGRFPALGTAIRTRCVQCHMPLQESAGLTSQSGGRRTHAVLRAHRIAIY